MEVILLPSPILTKQDSKSNFKVFKLKLSESEYQFFIKF